MFLCCDMRLIYPEHVAAIAKWGCVFVTCKLILPYPFLSINKLIHNTPLAFGRLKKNIVYTQQKKTLGESSTFEAK